MRENQIQQFQNQHFGKLTVIEINGEFFFIGKEVAELLGYKNGSRDVNRHVDEEDRCIFQNYQNGTFEIPKHINVDYSTPYKKVRVQYEGERSVSREVGLSEGT